MISCSFVEPLHTAAQSAVLGFGVFRVLERYGITSGLSVAENVILQTTSVATATMPLAAGAHAAVCSCRACHGYAVPECLPRQADADNAT